MMTRGKKIQEQTPAAFQLKGSMFTLTILQLLTTDLNQLEKQLTVQVEKLPAFFHNAPVVIDLQKTASLDLRFCFEKLVVILQKHHLIPVGILGGTAELQAKALAAQLPTLKDKARLETSETFTEHSTQQTPTPLVYKPAKIIEKPVRSGQQIYAEKSDLIIFSSVGHGAEVLADGNIHIYGALRGRALAGISGDKNARITCHSLEAELISIAGIYLINDDNTPLITKTSAHAYLVNEKLCIKDFDS